MAKILVACEESQTVCKAFRELGHEAYSNDILDCSGGHPEWHLQMDSLEAIRLKKWDCMVAHPPCTYLTVTGNKWFYHPDDKHLPLDERRPHPRFPNRRQDREDAFKFFMELVNADIPYIAVENPIGIVSTRWRKPDQIIQPWQFGHQASKSTCLWIKGLPLLKPTDIVDKGEFTVYKSGKRVSKWYADAAKLSKEERARVRSVTFDGIAKAMSTQWGNFLNENL